MKIAKGFLWSLLYVCLNSFTSCAIKYPPPLIERCLHNQSNSGECTDLRKPDGEKSYTRENLVNYICTGSPDEKIMYDYVSKLRSDLIKCENQPRN